MARHDHLELVVNEKWPDHSVTQSKLKYKQQQLLTVSMGTVPANRIILANSFSLFR